jgi:hypothetical protein
VRASTKIMGVRVDQSRCRYMNAQSCAMAQASEIKAGRKHMIMLMRHGIPGAANGGK